MSALDAEDSDKVRHTDGKRTVDLTKIRSGVELGVCRNGFQTTTLTLDEEMLDWLQGLIGQYRHEQNKQDDQ